MGVAEWKTELTLPVPSRGQAGGDGGSPIKTLSPMFRAVKKKITQIVIEMFKGDFR